MENADFDQEMNMNLQSEHTSLIERLDKKDDMLNECKRKLKIFKRKLRIFKRKTENLQKEYDMVKVQLDKEKDELIQQYKKRDALKKSIATIVSKSNHLRLLLNKRKEIEIPKHENHFEIKAEKCLPAELFHLPKENA